MKTKIGINMVRMEGIHARGHPDSLIYCGQIDIETLYLKKYLMNTYICTYVYM